MSYKTVNQIFIDKIDLVKSEKKITYSGIAEHLGISENKMKSIRRGSASATTDMLYELDQLFPEVFVEENEDKTDIRADIQQLKEDVKILKARNSNLELAVYSLRQLAVANNQNIMKNEKKHLTEEEELEIVTQRIEELRAIRLELLAKKGLTD